jgi:hypothetical protein
VIDLKGIKAFALLVGVSIFGTVFSAGLFCLFWRSIRFFNWMMN